MSTAARIGEANFFRQLEFTTAAETYDITPAGDPCGLYLGAVVPRFTATDTDTAQPKSISVAVLVGGTVKFFTRFINRPLFKPYQAYMQQGTPGQLIWSEVAKTTPATPSGAIFGTLTLVSKPSAAPIRSYMNAYFKPATTSGPDNAPLPFTVGTAPVTSDEGYASHAEPIYFWIDRSPGDAITIRCRVYREQPLSTLASPINDDLPADKIGAEPDEVLESQNVFINAWVLRVGPSGITTETPETYDRSASGTGEEG
jgi:hypothetical protein